jgi:hypothetical protein
MMSDAKTKKVAVPFAHSDIVRLKLTTQQAEQIVPLIERASACEKNTLFVAAAVPFWDDGAPVWEWQLALIPARTGQKICKLVTAQEVKNGSLSTPWS